MQLDPPIRQHKTTSQQKKVEQHLERAVEDERLNRLKACLQARLESPNSKDEIRAA